MIGIIFEVWPKTERKDEYLKTAAEMRAMLDELDGFISVERFESLTEPGKILSLSFFRDEETVERWRNTLEHRQAQAMGRNDFFDDYRIRVVETMRDYTMSRRDEVPADSIEVHG